MLKRNQWAPALVFMAFSLAAVACGDGGEDRTALEQDELERELELALQGDTAPPTFEDTAPPESSEEPSARSQPAPRSTPPQRTQPPQRQSPSPAERPAPSTPPAPVMNRVPAGTTFGVQLNETLSTEESAPGDGFTATLHDPIVGMDGSVFIPSGATVRGRVTAVDKSDRVGETAVIKLAFESISFGGRSYPLQATVVEANPQRRTRTTTGQQAAKIAAGTAAGAILGQVLGKNTESTIKGAAIGAAAGTAIAMGTADVDAVLPSGSRMVLRLDAPLEVRATS